MEASKVKKVVQKIWRILWKSILVILLLLILLIILIQTAPVQNFIVKKAQNWLKDKLQTEVSIGRLYINFPKYLVLEKLYVETPQKDTLIYSGKLEVNLNMWKLTRGQYHVSDLYWNDLTARITRDTAFNFQFIIDAFSSGDTTITATAPPSSATEPMNIQLNNIHLQNFDIRYHDDMTGNFADVLFNELSVKARSFQPDPLIVDIPDITLDGLKGSFIQKDPTVPPVPDTTASAPMQLLLDKITLTRTDFLFKSSTAHIETGIQLDRFDLKLNTIDIDKALLDIQNIGLTNTTAFVTLTAPGNTAPAPDTEADTSSAGWTINVKNLNVDNANIKFDDATAPRQAQGMDYMHLQANNLNLTMNDFYMGNDTIQGNITRAALQERSGLKLQQLRADFLYSEREAWLKNLYLSTPGTLLKDELYIRYPSIAAISDQPERLYLELRLKQSKVLIEDVLIFAPQLTEVPGFADRKATLRFDTQLKGPLGDLSIAQFNVSGWRSTYLNMDGHITNIFDLKALNADIRLKEFHTTSDDIYSLLPVNTLPDSFSIPATIDINGKLHGTTEDLTADLVINTSDGNVTLNGNASNIDDSLHILYNTTLFTEQLAVGKIIGQEAIGPLSLQLKAKGQGIVPERLQSAFELIVDSASYNGYTYTDLRANGSVDSMLVDLNAHIQNAAIHLSMDAKGDFNHPYPALYVNTTIDSIKTRDLHLTEDTIIYRGQVVADFKNVNPDSLDGELKIVQSVLVMNDQRLQIDSIGLQAMQTDTGEVIKLQAPFLFAHIWGNFEITQLGYIAQREANKYFQTRFNTDSVIITEPYTISGNIDIYRHNSLQSFLPELYRLDSIQIRMRGDNENGLRLFAAAPRITYGSNDITDLRFFITTRDTNNLNGYVNIREFKSGGLTLNKTQVQATAHDNHLDVNLHIHDAQEKLKYHLAANVQQPHSGAYQLHLDPDSLMMNYNLWRLDPGNRIYLDSSNIMVNAFTLQYNNQELSILTDTAAQGYPLTAAFKDFRIATLASFVQSDSMQMDGVINGYATVKYLLQDMELQSEIGIKDFNMNGDTIGSLQANILNEQPGIFNIDAGLTDRGNDVKITGTYNTNRDIDNPMNIQVRIGTLPMQTLEKLSMGYLRRTQGNIAGDIRVNGSPSAPSVNGEISFHNAVFAPYPLNSLLKIDNDKISIDQRGIHFSQFDIIDSSGQKATINGDALTTNFVNYNFNLTLNAQNFQVVNKEREIGDIFFGQVFLNTQLNINGTELSPDVEGSLQVNNKTDFTFILPQEDPSIVDREGIVHFIDKDALPNDTLFVNHYDSLNTVAVRDFDINLNITIDKEAILNVIVDEGNGDMLTVQGTANLTGGIDPSGKITMTGTYELEKGSYNLSFNFIKREFQIQKGSTLTWQGEPTMAEVDITAIYIANTGPIDLVENQLSGVDASVKNTYRQRLPFEVHLMMKDQLLKPTITFDIKLPEDGNYTVGKDVIETANNKLAQIRQEPAEMNKQVFALLLLNRFVSENPFETGNAGLSAESLARRSVSRLLSDQLNNLAANLIQGVDINFDLQSTEDYTTGTKANRTDLNVALSKQLLNDRLTVTIGSNFEIEGPAQGQNTNLADNVALDYRLSKDGRYMLRGYRKNRFEGVLEGFIVETGIGFILTVDYNRFRSVFESEKKRQRRQEAIRKRLEQKQQNKDAE